MFNRLKNIISGKQHEIILLAPIEGAVVTIDKVNDPTFSQELLGKGVAILPSRGRVVAPVNGRIDLMFETGHAVSLVSEDGVEVLIHVGLDTMKLKGQHYKIHAQSGDQVKTGDLLMEFDIDEIVSAGYDIITPVVVCNPADFKEFKIVANKQVEELDVLIKLKK